jgi:RimJ/RimL family protein N-acetyltransferase
MRFIGAGLPATPEESSAQSTAIAAHWEQFGFGLWAVSVAGDVVGFAGLAHPLWWPQERENVEVGWRLRRESWGQGYATEAARAAVSLAFGTLGLERVVSYIELGNTRSDAVAERLGMEIARVVAHPRRPKTLRVWELRADRPRSAAA